MSKSLGNYVGVTDSPNEIFGKVDVDQRHLMWRWYEAPDRRGGRRCAAAARGRERGDRHPRDLKVGLARILVARFHGDASADEP